MADSDDRVIYCVVPEEFGPELLERLTAYYADDPAVEVIVDRRAADRRGGEVDVDASRRELRDRRRPPSASDLPPSLG